MRTTSNSGGGETWRRSRSEMTKTYHIDRCEELGGADGGHFSQSTLNLDAEEIVSKKARVARNVLHNRGEDELKFDVSEDCPNAELASRSSHEGALIDGLPAQSQGWR